MYNITDFNLQIASKHPVATVNCLNTVIQKEGWKQGRHFNNRCDP